MNTQNGELLGQFTLYFVINAQLDQATDVGPIFESRACVRVCMEVNGTDVNLVW